MCLLGAAAPKPLRPPADAAQKALRFYFDVGAEATIYIDDTYAKSPHRFQPTRQDGLPLLCPNRAPFLPNIKSTTISANVPQVHMDQFLAQPYES